MPVDGRSGRRQAVSLVEDLLEARHKIRIRDRSTSISLNPGQVFVGRAIPLDENDKTYHLLGSVSSLRPQLWAILEPKIEEWHDRFRKDPAVPWGQQFYRAHHAQIRRLILQIVGTS